MALAAVLMTAALLNAARAAGGTVEQCDDLHGTVQNLDPHETLARGSAEPHKGFAAEPHATCQNFVYILPLPTALNADLLACYEEKFGVPALEDERKERAQNTVDVWVHRLLDRHQCRTHDIAKASVVLVPFYGHISSPQRGYFKPKDTLCGGLNSMHRLKVRDRRSFASTSLLTFTPSPAERQTLHPCTHPAPP
jgi:hypothetical protein